MAKNYNRSLIEASLDPLLIIDGLIKSGTGSVKLLETNDMWLGLIYK